jgi:hypothetical protein
MEGGLFGQLACELRTYLVVVGKKGGYAVSTAESALVSRRAVRVSIEGHGERVMYVACYGCCAQL